jgi:hypothetical protein
MQLIYDHLEDSVFAPKPCAHASCTNSHCDGSACYTSFLFLAFFCVRHVCCSFDGTIEDELAVGADLLFLDGEDSGASGIGVRIVLGMGSNI